MFLKCFQLLLVIRSYNYHFFALQSFSLVFSLAQYLFLILSEFLSVSLCAPLLKTVSALLLLHQKAVAK